MAKNTTKMSFNFSQDLLDVLRDMAESEGTTMTEVIKRSIAVRRYLTEEASRGKKVMVEDPSTESSKELIFDLMNR